MPEVRVDRRDEDPHLDRNEIDTDERNANPSVDDDAFVEHTIEYVYDAGAGWLKGCQNEPVLKI